MVAIDVIDARRATKRREAIAFRAREGKESPVGEKRTSLVEAQRWRSGSANLPDDRGAVDDPCARPWVDGFVGGIGAGAAMLGEAVAEEDAAAEAITDGAETARDVDEDEDEDENDEADPDGAVDVLAGAR
jgi:hypothetical protein